jgi:hypothetical protein
LEEEVITLHLLNHLLAKHFNPQSIRRITSLYLVLLLRMPTLLRSPSLVIFPTVLPTLLSKKGAPAEEGE